MKLSYRDKVIALVFAVVAIVLLFVFLGIRPTLNKISSNKSTLVTKTQEADDMKAKIAEIPAINEKIMAAYNEGASMADNFFIISEGDIETLDTYKIDQFLQPILNENNISINGDVSLNPADEITMEYYYYTPNIVTYPILEAADLNGTLAEDIYKRIETSAVFSEKEVQEVQGMSVEYAIMATKPDLLNFLDAIENINKSVIISDLSVKDYTFGLGQGEAVPEEEQLSECTFTMNFYSMQKVAKPNLD